MNTPLSRLQHDISLAPGIPDSFRLFGEGPTVSTYGDLREVVRQLDVRHLTSAERAWGEEAASAALSAISPSQGTATVDSGLAAADNNHKALVEALKDVVCAYAMNNAEPPELVAAMRHPITRASQALAAYEDRP